MSERKQSRSRGASIWAMRVYDAMYENPEGLSRDRLLAECVERFPRSGTMEWFRQMMGGRDVMIENRRTYSLSSPYRDVVWLKMMRTLAVMSTADPRQAVNGHPRNARNPLWMPGVPPKYWHPRSYQPGGFREYIPTEQTAIGARQALLMRWPTQARAELARPRPRSAELVRLINDALTLIEAS